MRSVSIILAAMALAAVVGCATPIQQESFTVSKGKALVEYLTAAEPAISEDSGNTVRACRRGDWVYIQKIELRGVHHETGQTELYEYPGIKVPWYDAELREAVDVGELTRDWQISLELRELALEEQE